MPQPTPQWQCPSQTTVCKKWGLLSWMRHVRMYCFSNTNADTKTSCRHFDCVAPVFFKAKIVHSLNVSFLYLRAASSVITVCTQSFSGCRTCSAGQVLLSSQGSHPASGRLKPYVPDKAFLSWGHLNVFLEQQLPGVPGHVNHCGLLPFDGVVVFPCMLATADFSRVPFWQASWCSLSLVSSLLLLSPR